MHSTLQIRLVLLTFVTSLSLPVFAGVLAGPIINPANHHAYYLLTRLSWEDSEAEAMVLGGHLVTINDAAENQWVADTFFPLTQIVPCSLWIGLNDVAEEGRFVWSSGEPVTFTYWYPGEPNNAGGLEDFTVIRHPTEASPTVSWNDQIGSTDGGSPTYPVFGIVEAVSQRPFRTATGKAQLVNGFVVGVTITDGGSGYSDSPLVSFVGGGGTGATGLAVVQNGAVVQIRMVSAGAGYTDAPVVKIASPPRPPELAIRVTKVEVDFRLVLGRTYQIYSSADLAIWNRVGSEFVAQDELVTKEFDTRETGQYFTVSEIAP